MPRTRIKICGITDRDGLLAAADAGADAVGFVFHRGSRRFIEPESAFTLGGLLPPFVSSVGLFVDATLEEFSDIEERCPTTLSQLHGRESVEIARQCGPGVIKAVRFDERTIAEELLLWQGVDEVDAILVDGSSGGEGVAFDWSALVEPALSIDKPLIIAGGLTPGNVGQAIGLLRPFGVDVSSGVESSPGEKDAGLMEAFCRAVREADARNAG